MLKSFVSGLLANSELEGLADGLVAIIVKRLPAAEAAGSTPRAGRQIDVLLGGLAARAARHRYERGWGWFGRRALGRRLRKQLREAGYDVAFANKAVWRITA